MSHNSKTIRIRILNPAGYCPNTSLAHARRYVRRGTAIWEDGAIRFVTAAIPSADYSPELDVRYHLPFTYCWRNSEAAVLYPPAEWVARTGRRGSACV